MAEPEVNDKTFYTKISKINLILNKKFDFREDEISHPSILEEKPLIEKNALNSEEISNETEDKSEISEQNQDKENSVDIKPNRKALKDLKNFKERLKV